MAITRDTIKPPHLPKEAVRVAPLGGEVVVRGLLLAERLAIVGALRRYDKPAEQGDDPQAEIQRIRERDVTEVDFSYVAKMLALCVLADDGEPVWPDPQAWEIFGAQHMTDAMNLFAKCQELSGMDAGASKKS